MLQTEQRFQGLDSFNGNWNFPTQAKAGLEWATRLKYALGILNSSLLNWYFRKKFTSNNHIASNQLEQLPLPTPSSARQKQLSAEITANVTKIIAASQRLHNAALSSSQAQRLEEQVTDLDSKIDASVFKLFGISADEVRGILALE